MSTKIQALDDNGTRSFIGLKPIECRWVYKIKYKADWSIEKYKAHLLAKEYNQIEGMAYMETFVPVAKLTIVRCLLAIVAARDVNWTCRIKSPMALSKKARAGSVEPSQDSGRAQLWGFEQSLRWPVWLEP